MILAIDTTGFKCGTALWDNGRITLLETEEKLRHNEAIFIQIQRLLQGRNSSLSDIDAVSVSSGPGSFTGLRVGMAVAKSLCWSLEIPFIAVPTLEGLANCAPVDIYSVIAIMPARANEVYWSHFVYANNRWEDQTLERLNTLEEMQHELTVEALFIGEGYAKHQNRLEQICGDLIMNNRVAAEPRLLVEATVKLAAARFEENIFDDLMESEPRYCYQFPRRQA